MSESVRQDIYIYILYIYINICIHKYKYMRDIRDARVEMRREREVRLERYN